MRRRQQPGIGGLAERMLLKIVYMPRCRDAWAARNSRQVGYARRGAGVSPAAARIRRIVPAPMR